MSQSQIVEYRIPLESYQDRLEMAYNISTASSALS